MLGVAAPDRRGRALTAAMRTAAEVALSAITGDRLFRFTRQAGGLMRTTREPERHGHRWHEQPREEDHIERRDRARRRSHVDL